MFCFVLFFFISFAIPKYNIYNNYNYYHKAYIHKLTSYTPKHTCNSTITTQGNAYCYFTSVIQKRRNYINHFFQKKKKYLDYKVHLSINFCKFLFLVQIYFSISYLPFILTIKLFMVGSSSFLLQLHRYIFPISIR